MAQLKEDSARKSYEMGLHTEQLAGRTQQRFFSAEENDNFTYPQAFEVDFDKTAKIDAAEIEGPAANLRIRELMGEGYGHIVVKNPLAKHSLGVGILGGFGHWAYRLRRPGGRARALRQLRPAAH